MKQSSSFFSSKHSALVLGLMLGASALVGSITYAQLNIPSTIENMRITIRQIFLSSDGISTSPDAAIVLDGTSGRTKTNSLTVREQVKFDAHTCNPLSPTERCVLMTDHEGVVTRMNRDEFNERMSSTNGDVFKRNPSNANDSFFATASGNAAEAGKDYLRVGVTETGVITTEPDTAMLVAGTTEIRGDLALRKVNGTNLGNDPKNRNFNITNDPAGYTELTTEISNQKIEYNTQYRPNALSATTNADIVFNARNVGINTTNPEATLHVEKGGTVQFGNREYSIDTSDCRWTSDGLWGNAGDRTEYEERAFDEGRIECNTYESYPTVSVNTDRNETFMLGNIRMNWYTGNDSYYNNYQLPTGVYPYFMDVVRPSWLTMISDGAYWHSGIMNVGTNVRDTRSTLNASSISSLYGLRVGVPDRTKGWSSIPFEVNGDRFLLAEFVRKIPVNPTIAWDSTALIDIVNGAKVRWRYGAGGTGYNGLGMNDSQFYIEKVGGGSLFTISTGGRVGIGTNLTTPQKKLDVRGNASITENLIIGHDAAFDPGSDRLNVNGSARANAYYYNSDAKYKSDITPLTSSLDNILKLNGYSYYNKLSEKNDIGVIAQEVEKVFPSLVQTDADGYKSVAYGNLVAPLIEAVKELSAKIDELFDKYVDQQAQIDALEARIQALENNK